MVSPYDVLMVDQDASDDEIESAYRERLKDVHPDQGGSAAEFRLVQSAYEEIQTGVAERGGATSDSLTCARCDSEIRNPATATYEEASDRIFCSDCVVETRCEVCETTLTLTADQYAEIDGTPVCESCGPAAQCSKCGTVFERDEAIRWERTGEILCPDCLIETNCARCGRALTLTADRFLALEGEPVCQSCTRSTIRCDMCVSVFDQEDAIRWERTDGVLCPDCVVETACVSCGTGLTLTEKRFADLDGSPVCAACAEDDDRTSADTGGSWWPYLVGVIVLGVGLALVYVSMQSGGISESATGELAGALLSPGLLYLLWRHSG